MEEVTIIGPVGVDISGGDLNTLGGHAAIAPAEPVEAVYVRQDERRRVCRVVEVHAFTAYGTPLVLGKRGLVPAADAAGSTESFDRLRPQVEKVMVGPFTPAPPGMVARFAGSSMLPVLYFDVHGRPVSIDTDTGALFLVSDDDDLQGVAGLPIALPPLT